MRHLVTRAAGAADADFSRGQFHETYTTDLVNTFGNCAQSNVGDDRQVLRWSLPDRHGACAGGGVEWPTFTRRNWLTGRSPPRWSSSISRFRCRCDVDRRARSMSSINDTAPFKLAKDPEAAPLVELHPVSMREAIRIAACLLEATMPTRMQELRSAWNLGDATGDLRQECAWGRLGQSTTIDKVALFSRVDFDDQAERVRRSEGVRPSC